MIKTQVSEGNELTLSVGLDVGSVSNFEKKSVGASFAGAFETYTLGSLDGLGVGKSVGVIDGMAVGVIVGFSVGSTVGGLKKGSIVPNMRSFQTSIMGASVGAKVGCQGKSVVTQCQQLSSVRNERFEIAND